MKTLYVTFLFIMASCTISIATTIIVPVDYPTIQMAVDMASSGDTVLVNPGTYYENIEVQSKDLHLIGSGASQTIIDGGNNGSVINFKNGDGTISGFTIQNSGSATFSRGIFLSVANIVVEDNIIKNNKEGISVSSNSDATIRGNKIIDNIGSIVSAAISFNSSSGIVVNNIIANNSSYGIVGDPSVIANNTIYGHGGFGVLLELSDIIISNNIITNNEHGIYLSTGNPPPYNSLKISYNNVWNNTSDNYSYTWATYNTNGTGSGGSGTLNPGTGGISLDPQFINADSGNFQLQSSSPCINSGNPNVDGLNLPSYDLAGNNRILSTVDIGAYEYDSCIAGSVDTSLTYNTNGLSSNAINSIYQWIDCDDGLSLIVGDTNRYFNLNTNGNYAVIIDNNGCIDTSSCIVINDVGIEDNDLNQPSITSYNNTITIKGKGTATIYNLTGQRVYHSKLTGNTSISLGKGIYLVRVSSEGKNVTKKIYLQ